MADGDEDDQKARELASRNRRLAIVLALIAVAIYVGFMLGYA